MNGTYIPYDVSEGQQSIDVRQYAGQEVELRFVTPRPLSPTEYYMFDVTGFYPIPEPSTWALLAIGAGALGFLVRRRRQKRR